MSNTITSSRVITGNFQTVIYFTLTCVSNTQETATIVYDSSVIATALKVADPLYSKIQQIRYATNSLLGVAKLSWDATTDVDAFGLPGGAAGPMDMDFKDIGGLPNTGGSGITGDILLTTTGLVTGDVLTLVLYVKAA